MRSYKPEELFDGEGRLIPELKALAPKGNRRMSANPIANGGLVRKPLELPDFRSSGIEVKKPGATLAGNVPTLGNFLREVMRRNMGCLVRNSNPNVLMVESAENRYRDDAANRFEPPEVRSVLA